MAKLKCKECGIESKSTIAGAVSQMFLGSSRIAGDIPLYKCKKHSGIFCWDCAPKAGLFQKFPVCPKCGEKMKKI